MGIKARVSILSLIVAFGLGFSVQASALNILLTNDDGCNSPGIQAMRGGLLAAGHSVTIVAPATEQSGQGGASNASNEAVVAVTEASPGVFCAEGSPADAVRIGLDVVMASNTPDLIVSGGNFGQNIGQGAVAMSGTINAALAGMRASGIPAIAVSVGLDLSRLDSSNPANLCYIGPPTYYTLCAVLDAFAGMQPAAGFTARLIAALQAASKGGTLLPANTIANVNVPTPYGWNQGVVVTKLDAVSDIEFVWSDNGDGTVTNYFSVNGPTAYDMPPKTDINAEWFRYISVTLVSGDATANNGLNSVIKGMTP